jgi:hypothetical protein
MNQPGNALDRFGLSIPEMFIPSDAADVSLWPVIACDQYTSEPEYWERVENTVGDSPSTLRCVFPECYLEVPGGEERIAAIHAAMRRYLSSGILRPLPPGVILVDRATPYRPSRRGLLTAIDLERYDYRPGTKSLVRPTEGTILERLPPRIRIRQNAPLEFPHVLVLLDDPGKTVIEPLFESAAGAQPLYNTELMLAGGRITGRFLPKADAEPRLIKSLEKLMPAKDSAGPGGAEDFFLFAVGDGNHSLAAAKAVWEELKTRDALGAEADHPARYALVEIVNLYDPGIQFEPIHRLLSGFSEPEFTAFLKTRAEIEIQPCRSFADMESRTAESGKNSNSPHTAGILSPRGESVITITSAPGAVTAQIVQDLLDEFLRNRTGGSIDYIHGAESLRALCRKPGALGFFLPAIEKSGLFPTVLRDGALPKKAFSIGEASEKRFYFESRKIVV